MDRSLAVSRGAKAWVSTNRMVSELPQTRAPTARKAPPQVFGTISRETKSAFEPSPAGSKSHGRARYETTMYRKVHHLLHSQTSNQPPLCR